MEVTMKMKILCAVMTLLLWIPAAAIAQGAAVSGKPDLAVEKIYLNPTGNISVEIRNAGTVPLPDKAWAATESYTTCFVIMIGVQFADYVAIWSADPDRKLKNPGGSIVYTSTIKITEPTRVRVWLDPTEQIDDANRANNVKEVPLKP